MDGEISPVVSARGRHAHVRINKNINGVAGWFEYDGPIASVMEFLEIELAQPGTLEIKLLLHDPE